jgi:hypothetical protein
VRRGWGAGGWGLGAEGWGLRAGGWRSCPGAMGWCSGRVNSGAGGRAGEGGGRGLAGEQATARAALVDGRARCSGAAGAASAWPRGSPCGPQPAPSSGACSSGLGPSPATPGRAPHLSSKPTIMQPSVPPCKKPLARAAKAHSSEGAHMRAGASSYLRVGWWRATWWAALRVGRGQGARAAAAILADDRALCPSHMSPPPPPPEKHSPLPLQEAHR